MSLPGIYHGGWHHVGKIIVAIISDTESNNIKLLFPRENLNLWFYEITGVLEFILGVVLAYYLYKFISNNAVLNPLVGSNR